MKHRTERYGWIGEGFQELQSSPETGLSLKRYEELIQKEKTLDILCRLIAADKPYRFDLYQAVAGEYFPIEKEEKKDESKPQ